MLQQVGALLEDGGVSRLQGSFQAPWLVTQPASTEQGQA